MLRQVSASALVLALAYAEPSGPEACCGSCAAPQAKYFEVDAERRHCKETCLDPATFYALDVLMENNLTKAGSDGVGCTGVGFGTFDQSEKVGMPPFITISFDKYNLSAVAETGAMLHAVLGEECGQLTLSPALSGSSQVLSLVGLKDGPCADEGYTLAVGSQATTLPLLGRLAVDLFKKPSFLGVAMDLVETAQSQAEPQQAGRCCQECAAPEVKYLAMGKEGELCKEACLSPWALAAISLLGEERFAPAEGASCAERGFSTYEATESRGAGFVSVALDRYGPTPIGSEGAMHAVVDGLCAQVDTEEEASSSLEHGGFVAGTCAESDFALPVSSTELDLPAVGPTKVQLFRKAGEAGTFATELARKVSSPLGLASLMV